MVSTVAVVCARSGLKVGISFSMSSVGYSQQNGEGKMVKQGTNPSCNLGAPKIELISKDTSASKTRQSADPTDIGGSDTSVGQSGVGKNVFSTSVDALVNSLLLK